MLLTTARLDSTSSGYKCHFHPRAFHDKYGCLYFKCACKVTFNKTWTIIYRIALIWLGFKVILNVVHEVALISNKSNSRLRRHEQSLFLIAKCIRFLRSHLVSFSCEIRLILKSSKENQLLCEVRPKRERKRQE